jgi:HK97 family phage prohead protease
MKKNKKEFEQRSYFFEVRTEKREDGIARLSGMPIVYSSPTDIGGMFREIIEPGALDGANLKDVPLLVNHNDRMIPVARSRNNNGNSTMQLSPNALGLNFDADIDIGRNMTAMELYSAVDRGDLNGMSFRFSISDEEWENLETEYPTRHIRKIDVVAEISAVTWAAYPATQIYARSKEALDNARSALESARKQRESSSDDELELLKSKIRLI